jgi:hypothetical protein
MTRVWTQRIILAAAMLIIGASDGYSIGLPKNWERAVVFLEHKRFPGKPCQPNTQFTSPDEEKTAPGYCPVGSGFVMKICGQSLLFSNRHVLSQQSKFPLVVRMENKAGKFERFNIGDWKGHPHDEIDIAASFVDTPEGFKIEDFVFSFFNEDTDRKAKEPQSFLVKLEDLRVGDDVLLVGYPSSIPGVLDILQAYDAPIFRAGIVSQKFPGVTRLKRWKGGALVEEPMRDFFLTDARAFPGNSGSPVFLLPTRVRYGNDRPHVNLNRPYIVGVLAAGLVQSDLAVVYAADGIEETAAQFPGAKCPPPLSTQPHK